MNHQPKRENRETWYPLTYPGYYTAELTRVHSFRHECCRLDLSRFRGQTIGVAAFSEEPESICTLTDEKGEILAQWETMPETLLVPQNALHLYLNNDYDKHSDFFVSIPSGAEKTAEGFLFDCDFTDGASLDGNAFFGESPVKKCTSDGFVLPSGIENALVMNTSTALDDWSLTARITAPKGDEVVCLGTRSTQERNCPHASLCCVDLGKGELILFRGGKGREMPQEAVQRVSLGAVVEKGDFELSMERIDQAIRAVVRNPETGAEISVLQEVMQVEDPPASVAGGCRAGKMYDSPQVFALSGEPCIRRLYGKANTSPKVVFFGDSITQGAHNLPREGWAQLCAADIGNSICCGRGSGDIWSCLNQVRTLIPILRPKAMVITIGTNNLENKVSTETVRGLYHKFITMSEFWGVKLILNCIPVCSRPHVGRTNHVIRSLNVAGSRFDTALTLNHTEEGEQDLQYFSVDGVHLNPEGNKVLHNLFMKDFPWLLEL